MTVFKAAFESKKLECTRGWGIVWWKYLLLINESTPKAKVRYPNDGFLCSVLLRMSSEWCLALRIHNTDQQCYEFWVLEVIPSSFRVARNVRKSVIGIPNSRYFSLNHISIRKLPILNVGARKNGLLKD